MTKTKDLKPVRIWPGAILAGLMLTTRYIIPAILPGTYMFAVMSGLGGGLAVLIWWAFFSRIPHLERWGALLFSTVCFILTTYLLDVSISTGFQGMMFMMYGIPAITLGLTGWAVIRDYLPDNFKQVSLAVIIFISSFMWVLVRSEGITGDEGADFTWRWKSTPEEILISAGDDEIKPDNIGNIPVETDFNWPGFRGKNRDSVVKGLRINTNWKKAPPDELWRRPIGPGCSSFAVTGNLIFTQEQRGEHEIVSCYSLLTGEPVWSHSDKARFWDSHAGAGPRSTPALHAGQIYTLGATGIMNALNVVDGSLVWTRNAAEDTKAEDPGWGFTGSPLIMDDLVIVAVSGNLIAYDLNSGETRWKQTERGNSYSSPHLLDMDGDPQVIMMGATGAAGISPATGKILWEKAWKTDHIVQPALIPGGDLILNTGYLEGLGRVTIKSDGDTYNVVEHWISDGLKPDFNDFVVHKGHAYGFEGPRIACIDLETGGRMWKGGRYGGQMLLLADQDMLLVLSEKGEIALVEADPGGFSEVNKLQAIEGKTWNHPVIAGDILVVRNTREMAAFKLPLKTD